MQDMLQEQWYTYIFRDDAVGYKDQRPFLSQCGKVSPDAEDLGSRS